MAIPSSGAIPRPVVQILAILFAVVMAIGLGNAFLWGADEPVRVPRTTVAPVPTTTTQAPYWMGKYGWDYKEFLDNLTAVRNCTKLHSEYIRAMTGNARIAEQFGTGTADLMEYIFKAEDRVGCFG
ncbi:MAG TPA: hypothetical protein EYM46_07805 [Acidimicrobiia bacterium]|nr:hypothetical protein [Acidimicrobiaceae bacterium]HIM66450.1 hypothetical protein [Acidimicrobiia bacterium]